MSDEQPNPSENEAVPLETSATFDELKSETPATSSEDNDLDVVLDIPVHMTVEIGSTDITVRNLLRLHQGSVVELDRLAGEALDIKVNGTLVAHGEVVVTNNKFGVRLTEVISTSERIEKLR